MQVNGCSKLGLALKGDDVDETLRKDEDDNDNVLDTESGQLVGKFCWKAASSACQSFSRKACFTPKTALFRTKRGQRPAWLWYLAVIMTYTSGLD